MKILVLGGLGRQGKVVAETLAHQGHDVCVADGATTAQFPKGTCEYIKADLSNYRELIALMKKYDMAVCTLPSVLGYNCVKAAVEVGINAVDLSFSAEDLSVFDEEAKQKGISVIVDAGVAPGLSNLVAGRAMLTDTQSIQIAVGGVPQNHNEPFGYTITWSLEDLMEEYTRPARILVSGKVETVPALTDNVVFDIGKYAQSSAQLEAFYTDGLRSLLINNGGIPNLSEKTVRWQGHVDAIVPYLKTSKDDLAQAIKKQCKENAPDFLVLRITSDNEDAIMITSSDEKMSAMAKTTALSCATFASLLASCKLTQVGVLPPEKLSADDDIYKFILDEMAKYGVVFNKQYPFM